MLGLRVQTREVAGWWIQDLAEQRDRERWWASGKWDLGEMLGGWAVFDVGVWDYVPGRLASHGRWRLGKVGACNGALADKNQTEALQSSDTQGVLSGAAEEEKQGANKHPVKGFFFFFLLLNGNKEALKM